MQTDLLGSNKMLRPGYQILIYFNVDDAENRRLQDGVAVSTTGHHWLKRLDICSVSSWQLTD